MKFIDKEHQLLKREEFLSGLNREEGDVMEDEKGEYVIIIMEDEDCNVTEDKVYLAKELALDFIPF